MAGQAKAWHNKYRYLVEIDGFISSGFQKAGPLKGGAEVIEHHEGNGLLPDKTPGKAKFENITLERGATVNMDEYEWFTSVLNASDDTGGANPDDYKRNLAIIEQDNAGNELMRWNVYGCWPVGFQAGDWDSSGNEKTIRSLELVIDYFDIG